MAPINLLYAHDTFCCMLTIARRSGMELFDTFIAETYFVSFR